MLAAADASPRESTPENSPQAAYAKVLVGKAVLCAEAGDIPAASRAGDEGLALYRLAGNKRGLAWALNGRALVYLLDGQYLAARDLIAEALDVVRETDDEAGVLLLTNNLGVLDFHLGDDSAALPLFEASLRLAGDRRNRRALSRAMNNIACVRVRRRDYAGAAGIGAEGLAMRHEIGDIRGVCESLELLAGAAGGLGEHARAVQLAAAARALRTRQGLGPSVDFLRGLADSALQSAIEVLGQGEVEAISAAAAALSTEDAVALGVLRLQS
jgi:tetratricopeptide (TPR) repeat protein